MKMFIILSIIQLISSTSYAKEITLEDLSFSNQDLSTSTLLQDLQTKRADMLETHQNLGYLTAALLTATMITGKEGDVTNTHKYLGITAGLSYYATAYYAINAPEVEGATKSGSSLWHKRLAWIHGPLMILEPALGVIAERQLNKGEDIHGIAKLHKPLAAVAFYSFLSSLAVITFDF